MSQPTIATGDLTAENYPSSPAPFSHSPRTPLSNRDVPLSNHEPAFSPPSRVSAVASLEPQPSRAQDKRKRAPSTPPHTPLKLKPFRKPDGEVVETPTYLESVAQRASSTRVAEEESVGEKLRRGMREREARRSAQKQRETSPCEEHIATRAHEKGFDVAKRPPKWTPTAEAEKWKDDGGFLQMFDNAFEVVKSTSTATPPKRKETWNAAPVDTIDISIWPGEKHNKWATRASTNFADLLIEYNNLSRKYDNLMQAHDELKDERNLWKGENEVLIEEIERLKRRVRELEAAEEGVFID